MSVLVDTSVWVAHFRQRNEQLVALLEAGLVVCHPYVVVEVACGTPPRRQAVVELLGQLEALPLASPEEVLTLIEQRQLYGKGGGLVDISLLASSLLSGQARLWTLDRRLATLADELNLAYHPTQNH